MEFFVVFGGIIVILLIWFVSVRNRIVTAEVKIEEATSGIDIALTKRYDVLTKMLDVVKGYASHEKETLKELVKLRTDMSMGEKNRANADMDELRRQIRVIVERYPDLKASENFKTLQISITDVEEHLQAARRLYNGNVTHFNNLIVIFPSNLVAGMMGKTKKEFFEAEAEKRADVKMEF